MAITFKDTIIKPVQELDSDFYDRIKSAPVLTQETGKRKKTKRKYLDVVSSFDIETTRVHDYSHDEIKKARENHEVLNDFTVMYIWQWAFSFRDPDGIHTVCTYGRKWSEFLDFARKITNLTGDNVYIVVYDHNLAYEFQFLKGILPFAVGDTFNVAPRQPLKAATWGLEFRCSLKLSNMSLRKFAQTMETPHQKTELEYTKKRYWYTPLTNKELEYCINDVICLNECIIKKMDDEGDNLYTIPLTSTGYVRRAVKQALYDSGYDIIKQIRAMAPDYDTYVELKEAFRGGNTHANRYYANKLMLSKDYGMIHSADRSSSYPAVMCNRMFPMERFKTASDCSMEEVLSLMKHGYAVLMRVKMRNVRLSNQYWGCPYLSDSKCRHVKNPLLDNGRIISADYLETTITDVDLKILLEEYDSDIEFYDIRYARYGKLPQPIIDTVILYYRNKTTLKGIEDKAYFYTKNKNLLNSIYGMTVQDLVKFLLLFINGDKAGECGKYKDDTEKSDREILEASNKKAFLNYAWGIWVTAWARYELEQGIKLAGENFIYCDTDSVKYIGDVDWTEYNNERIKESIASGSHATDRHGEEHYMGVFEQEHDMEAFITMGAKKYAMIEDGKLKITIAGVGKTEGVKELERKAKVAGCEPIELIREGFTFEGKAGGLEAVYNDFPLYETLTAPNDEGRPVQVISNVTLRPSTYTLGLAADYKRLLEGIEFSEADDKI